MQSDQLHVPAFFGHSKGPSLEPQPQYYTICCTVVAIWNYFWSFTIGSVASEPSSEQGRRKHTWNNLFTWSPTPSSPTVTYWLIFAEISPSLFILFDVDSEPDDHAEVLLLFVGCIVNFIVSYPICMFQDSVPAGSYNDPFLSSVCDSADHFFRQRCNVSCSACGSTPDLESAEWGVPWSSVLHAVQRDVLRDGRACPTPATRNDGGCEIVPRPNQTQARHPVPWVPRLPRKTLVDVRLCHACHAKRRWMWVCGTPATRNESGCEFVPCLPRETMVDVSLCHACHTKWRGVTRDQGAPKPDPSVPPTAMSATHATQNACGCEIVPRLPREAKVDVSLCHACHAKRRWMWVRATPATRNDGGCEFVPRLPRKMARRHARPARPNQTQARHPLPWVPRLPRETKVDVRLCHPCHAKRGWMWVCATPATQNGAASRATRARPNQTQARHPLPWVPRLPRETKVDVSLCHACHAKRWWMWVCATPATQNGAASRATRARPNQTQARHPLPWVPRLPRKTLVDVRLCHACHAKRRWMWVCATPASRNEGGCEFVLRLPRETMVDVSLCHACHASVMCVCV